MTKLRRVRKRHLWMMRTTAEIITQMMRPAGQEVVSTLRDGPDGWTALEVVGHIQAFDSYFWGRAKMMLEYDYPSLPAYDHEKLAMDEAYNQRDLEELLRDLVTSRDAFVQFFRDLSEEDWERAGVHPEQGHFTMTDAVMQVGLHDLNHIEQLVRILGQL